MAAFLLILAAFPLANVNAASDQATVDARTLFSLMERYCSLFNDISFIYEGEVADMGVDGHAHYDLRYRFQGLYAYRSDGATLLDVFTFDPRKNRDGRLVATLLRSRSAMLDASPDQRQSLRDRRPLETRGGPGILNRPDAPERMFLSWYFRTLGDPLDHDVTISKREEVKGRPCVKVRLLRRPRKPSDTQVNGIPVLQLWIDLERDGYPIRLEHYSEDGLTMRTDISDMVNIHRNDGRSFWLPKRGRTEVYSRFKDGNWQYSKQPLLVESHNIVTESLRLNQNLTDQYFDVKRHALVASVEELRKLQRELERKAKSHTLDQSPPSPDTIKKPLHEILVEADRQSKRLQASSAARAGSSWFELVTSGLTICGIASLAVASLWYLFLRRR
jgi:hypothetical protein